MFYLFNKASFITTVWENQDIIYVDIIVIIICGIAVVDRSITLYHKILG